MVDPINPVQDAPDTVVVVPYQKGQLILPTGYNKQAGIRVNPNSGIRPGQAVQYGEHYFLVGSNGELTRTRVNSNGRIIGQGPIRAHDPRSLTEKGSTANKNNNPAPPVPSIYQGAEVINAPRLANGKVNPNYDPTKPTITRYAERGSSGIKVSAKGSLTGGGQYQNSTGRFPSGTPTGVYGPGANPIIVQAGRSSAAAKLAAFNLNNQTYNDPTYRSRQRDARNREAQRQAKLGLANYQDEKGNTYNIQYPSLEANASYGSFTFGLGDPGPTDRGSNSLRPSDLFTVDTAFKVSQILAKLTTEGPGTLVFETPQGQRYSEGVQKRAIEFLPVKGLYKELTSVQYVPGSPIPIPRGSGVQGRIETLRTLSTDPDVIALQPAVALGALQFTPIGPLVDIGAGGYVGAKGGFNFITNPSFFQAGESSVDIALGGLSFFPTVKEVGGKFLTSEKVVLDTTRGPVTVKAYGLQYGTRGVTLYSKVTEPSPLGPIPSESPILLLNPLSDVRNTGVQGTLLNLKPTPSTLTLGELRGPVPTPESVALAKTVYQTLNLEPNLLQRTQFAARSSELLLKDTGRIVPPEQVFFPVSDIPTSQQLGFSRATERFAGQNDAFFFGSGTTQQLPELFQGKAIGDVDIIFTKATKQEIGDVLLPKLLKQYEREGIVGLSQNPKKPLVIQTVSGAKIFEAKSLFDIQPGDDVALAGFYGVRFPDLKKGGRPATVPFGVAQAITAGEQGARKGAASSFINPAFAEGDAASLPQAFQQGGVFGMTRRSDPRVLKDVAGFVQSEQGLLALRGEKNVFQRFVQFRSTSKAQSALNSYLGTFTPAERLGITEQLAKQIGEGGRSEGVFFTPETSKTVKLLLQERDAASPGLGFKNPVGFGSPSLSPSRGRVIESRIVSSPSVSSSPRSSYSLSRISSPALSPAISPSRLFSGSPSPRASPSRSPVRSSFSPGRSASPSPSLSPSPSFFGSPGRSPPSSLSPSPSRSPSPGRSPGRSPSAFVSPRSPFTNSISFPTGSPKLPGFEGSNKKDFEVYIRRFGKFSLLGSALSKEGAVGLGRSSVERSLGATFTVKENGQALSFSDLGGSIAENFRPGKNQSEFIIQKASKRLSSTEERIAIQRARKRKPVEAFL